MKSRLERVSEIEPDRLIEVAVHYNQNTFQGDPDSYSRNAIEWAAYLILAAEDFHAEKKGKLLMERIPKLSKGPKKTEAA